MESTPAVRQFRERQQRFHDRLEELRQQTEVLLEGLEQRMPTAADAARLTVLRGQREKLFQDYLARTGAFIEHLREVEKSNRRSNMPEKRAAAPRSNARIEQLSEELTTNLRLERVDEAMKELLDFLADADFFAANATTGRRRRLRTLQNAIGKVLGEAK